LWAAIWLEGDQLGQENEGVMSLETYRKKRRFETTSEPRPHIGKPHRRLIFVVQEHHASRLHYDFRLEADGVLKSWALPKQPTLDPTLKRLAVQVEDHPLDYAKFSGTIPAGQYGAGTVAIWDRGTYERLLAKKGSSQTLSEDIEAGHLEFILHGQKLKGSFALIRMRGRGKKPYWLLIKMKDEEARPTTTSSKPVQQQSAARQASRPPKSVPTPVTPARPTQLRPAAVPFSHEDKIMFPEAGVTKGDVLRFYEQISAHLLPHLRDRPVTLERLPEGLASAAAPHFWQKNTPSFYPRWIPRIKLPSEVGKPVNYVLVNDRETLLYLVNQGTLTFHTWLSRIQSLDQPDFVLFDLDPGAATWSMLVTVAQRLHAILEGANVPSFVKTSGKSGLHVMAPWAQAGGYDEARQWALQIAQQVVAALPDLATVEQRKLKRRGKVYLDVMQNARGHHAVPPYVLRAIPQATVSTPLQWRELTSRLQPHTFNLRTIFQRLTSQSADPMAPLVDSYRRETSSAGAGRREEDVTNPR
jgi:bifunctional non-homologous end joining protein LigD